MWSYQSSKTAKIIWVTLDGAMHMASLQADFSCCFRNLLQLICLAYVVTGDDELWGIDFNKQLVQRHSCVLERSPVLDSLVSDKSLKVADDSCLMAWLLPALPANCACPLWMMYVIYILQFVTPRILSPTNILCNRFEIRRLLKILLHCYATLWNLLGFRICSSKDSI